MQDDLFKPMTATQYSQVIEAMGLGASEAARMLGMTPRMSRSYVNDEYPVPMVHAVALRLIRDHVKPKDLVRFKSRPPGRPPAPQPKKKRRKA